MKVSGWWLVKLLAFAVVSSSGPGLNWHWMARLVGEGGWQGWMASLHVRAGWQGWMERFPGEAGLQGGVARLDGESACL